MPSSNVGLDTLPGTEERVVLQPRQGEQQSRDGGWGWEVSPGMGARVPER